jgi:hypothetical protein
MSRSSRRRLAGNAPAVAPETLDQLYQAAVRRTGASPGAVLGALQTVRGSVHFRPDPERPDASDRTMLALRDTFEQAARLNCWRYS